MFSLAMSQGGFGGHALLGNWMDFIPFFPFMQIRGAQIYCTTRRAKDLFSSDVFSFKTWSSSDPFASSQLQVPITMLKDYIDYITLDITFGTDLSHCFLSSMPLSFSALRIKSYHLKDIGNYAWGR